MGGDPDDDVQDWFGGLSYKLKRELAATIKEEADGLAAAVEEAAPKGKTLKLSKSVRVRRKRNELDLEVTAGGDDTTKFYGRSTGYAQEVVIDGRSNEGISKKADGEGVSYDYALASEYGTVNEEAQPFFYNTAREILPDIRERIEQKVEDVISRS